MEEVEGISERSGAVLVALPDDRLLLHGGECLGVNFGDCFVSSPLTASESVGVAFTPLALRENIAPCPRAGHNICLSGSQVVLFGGTTTMADGDTVYHNDVWTLSLNAGQEKQSGACEEVWEWTPLQSNETSFLAPSPRSLCAIMPLNPRVDVQQPLDVEEKIKMLGLSPTTATATSSIFSGDVLIFGGFGLMENCGDGNEDNEDEDDEKEDAVISSGDVTMSIDVNQEPETHNESPDSDAQASSVATTGRTNDENIMNIDESNNGVTEDDDDDSESVAEGYLGDCWLLDSRSGAFCEVTITGAHLKPLGGCTFASVSNHEGIQKCIAFGGFGGENYAGEVCRFATTQIAGDWESLDE